MEALNLIDYNNKDEINSRKTSVNEWECRWD